MSYAEIKGWFAFKGFYDQAVEEAKDGDTFVEIGVAFGRSVAYLARRVIDSGKKVTIYAVDPWVDDWWMFPNDYPTTSVRPTWGGEYAEWARTMGGPFRSFIAEMTAHAPEELEYIKVLRCYSYQAARLIGDCRMVMIDGNHNYEAVLNDIHIWRDKVVPGGLLAGDDYHANDFPGVVRAVKESFQSFDVSGTTWSVRK